MRDSFVGMLSIQVWAYYQRYPNDSASYKVLVRRSGTVSPSGVGRPSHVPAQVLSLWYAFPDRAESRAHCRLGF